MPVKGILGPREAPLPREAPPPPEIHGFQYQQIPLSVEVPGMETHTLVLPKKKSEVTFFASNVLRPAEAEPCSLFGAQKSHSEAPGWLAAWVQDPQVFKPADM